MASKPMRNPSLDLSVQAAVILAMAQTPQELSSLSATVMGSGYRVIAVSTLEDAIVAMVRTPVDLLAIQGVFPTVASAAILERLAQVPAAKKVPILFCNAFQDDSPEAAVLTHRIAGRIELHRGVYPLNSAALQTLVEKIISTKARAILAPQVTAIQSRGVDRNAQWQPASQSWRRPIYLGAAALFVLAIMYDMVTQRLFNKAAAAHHSDVARSSAGMQDVMDSLESTPSR